MFVTFMRQVSILQTLENFTSMANIVLSRCRWALKMLRITSVGLKLGKFGANAQLKLSRLPKRVKSPHILHLKAQDIFFLTFTLIED